MIICPGCNELVDPAEPYANDGVHCNKCADNNVVTDISDDEIILLNPAE